MERIKWLEELGKLIDSKDSESFVRFITEDGIFRFGNQPEVKGRAAIKNYVSEFFKMIKASEHKIIKFWDHGDSIIWQGEVTYTRHDDRKVNVNFTNIFYMKDGLISDYLIYIDNTPLFAE